MNTNTIIAAMAAIIAMIYMGKLLFLAKSNTTDFIVVILCLAIMGLCKDAYNLSANRENLYNAGYEKAIEDCVLWDIDDNGYSINFDGEIHEYKRLVPIKDND